MRKVLEFINKVWAVVDRVIVSEDFGIFFPLAGFGVLLLYRLGLVEFLFFAVWFVAMIRLCGKKD